MTLNGTPSVYTTEATSNRLTSTTNPARNFGYDSAGNTTSDTSGYTSTYDAAGRLATLTKAGVTTTYSYNGLGQRVRKFSSTGATSTNIFVYDQSGQLLGEYSNTGAAIREYVWLGSTPIAMFTPPPSGSTPVAYYFHTDHLNTPRVATDTAGNLRWRWMAEPFGATAPEDNPSNLGALTQNLRFPGQYADAESGLYYNYFRNYDSTTGRYNTSDPIGLAGGINTYAYVGSNPLMGIDPNGLLDLRNQGPIRFPRNPGPGEPGLPCATAECAARVLPAGQTAPAALLPGGVGFNQDRCVQDYLRDYYGAVGAEVMVPGFSLLSYVPGSGTASDAWISTGLSLSTKGLVVGIPAAMEIAIDASGAAGAGVRGGNSSRTLVRVGARAGSFARGGSAVMAVAGVGGRIVVDGGECSGPDSLCLPKVGGDTCVSSSIPIRF
ncbi:RHS repeat-associated core domain-containing protein [Rhizobacter sp. J219]|uniref:RHS repeat-associated core domain-containing protein n=1 Tax=Rhizobacter sp. J219 TaxID=2898430 RepID=UPI0027E266A6|nr:RHS repeat-associated core domain-containing protein [Rhizobacter sp. J219]